MINAIIYTIAFACIQIFTSLGFSMAHGYLYGEDVPMGVSMQLAAAATASIVTAIAFCALRWAKPTRAYILSRPWSVLCWSVIASLGAVIPSLWIQELMPELPNVIEQQMGDMMKHRGGYFVICLLAPVAEELVFRGAVLRSLLAWQPQRVWPMIAVSAALFALIHFNPAQMPHAFVIGLLLGWMYQRTGSLAPAIAFHWANNTVAYLLFRAYPDPSLRLVDLFSGQERAVLAAVGFSLLILLPAIYQLHLRMTRIDE